jgi:hypothetical protein
MLLGAVLALTGAATAPTGDRPSTTTSTTQPGYEPPHIIPRPNSGHAPTEAGDRGGALQLGLLALIVGGLGLIVVLIVRDSRRARASANRGPYRKDAPRPP